MTENTIIQSERYRIGTALGIIVVVVMLVMGSLMASINSDPIMFFAGAGSGAAYIGLICGLIYLWSKSFQLVVTDKRIYRKVAFGKQVDLPLDMISAVAINGFFKGIAVATSSGKISFLFVKNYQAVFKVIQDLLVKRQEKKDMTPSPVAVPVQSNASQLKEFKELLDSGIITQEEFDAKKKQLLGL